MMKGAARPAARQLAEPEEGGRTSTRLLHRTHFDDGWRRAKSAFAQALAGALRDQAGQDLTEYALLAGLIALVTAGAIRIAGVEVGSWWVAISARLSELFAGIL